MLLDCGYVKRGEKDKRERKKKRRKKEGGAHKSKSPTCRAKNAKMPQKFLGRKRTKKRGGEGPRGFRDKRQFRIKHKLVQQNAQFAQLYNTHTQK